jgi:anti-sigma B factor antagonist
MFPLLRHNTKTTSTLESKVIHSKDGVVVCLYGSLDIDSSPALRDRLLALLRAPHPKTVSVDLSAVTRVDSSSFATLIEALKIARGYKTELRLQGLPDQVLRVFEFTGILSLFDCSGRTITQPGCKVD